MFSDKIDVHTMTFLIWSANFKASSLRLATFFLIGGTILEMGKEVIRKEWAKSQKSIKLDLSSLGGGIYYCRLITKNKTIETHKILLTK